MEKDGGRFEISEGAAKRWEEPVADNPSEGRFIDDLNARVAEINSLEPGDKRNRRLGGLFNLYKELQVDIEEYIERLEYLNDHPDELEEISYEQRLLIVTNFHLLQSGSNRVFAEIKKFKGEKVISSLLESEVSRGKGIGVEDLLVAISTKL